MRLGPKARRPEVGDAGHRHPAEHILASSRYNAMTLTRTVLCLVLAIATTTGVASSMRSYQQWHFYTHVEEDFSIAEIYEVELWFKVPATLLGLAATLVAAAPMCRRT